MKKFLILLMSLIITGGTSFASPSSFVGCAAPYDLSSGIGRTLANATGSNLIAQQVAQSLIKRQLKKESGEKFKVKVSSYSMADLKAGRFKSLDISGENLDLDGVFVSYLDFKTLCDFNYIVFDKNTNSMFVDVYGCVNIPKHLTYTSNMMLNDVMTDIQFLESDVDVKETEDTKEPEVAYKGSVEENDVQLAVGTANSNKLIPAENIAVEITSTDGTTQVYYLYDIMINSDRIKSIAIMPEDKIFFRTLRGNEVLKTVKVSGFVKTRPVSSTYLPLKSFGDVYKSDI